jgi:hypothetical protein
MAVPGARPPIPPTALIGREGQIARVRELLAGSRLPGSRVAVPLDGLAIVGVFQGRVDRAVRLWGASDAELDSVRAALDTGLGT